VLDRRLAFDKHVLAVTRSCKFNAQAIRHIRHLLSTNLAHTVCQSGRLAHCVCQCQACSLILTRLDYCNSTAISSIQKLQRVWNNAVSDVAQYADSRPICATSLSMRTRVRSARSSSRHRSVPYQPLMRQLHWLPVQHKIDYNVSVLTYKTLNTSVPWYLNKLINRRVNARTLRSTATPLLIQPFARTDFAKRSFRCGAPSVWNSRRLSSDVLLVESRSVTVTTESSTNTCV